MLTVFHSRCYHTQFPRPTDCCLLLSMPQRSTFARTVLSCVLYRMPLLMSEREPTVDWVKEMLLTYRVSCCSVLGFIVIII